MYLLTFPIFVEYLKKLKNFFNNLNLNFLQNLNKSHPFQIWRMMRPATAKGHPKLSKGHSKDNSTPSGKVLGQEYSDFKVSGKELASNSSTANLPRYKSI